MSKYLLLLVPVLALGACMGGGNGGNGKHASAAEGGDVHDPEHPHSVVTEAVAVMRPTAGNEVGGTVRFSEVDGGVEIVAEITGLAPDSTHAIHVHQYGDARAEDGTSAGGHYNPEGHEHGLPDSEPRHAGDLGNLEADAEGNASYELTVDNISIDRAMNPVLGRGMIIHAKHDDGGQPTGNAGPRIAIGVIGAANPEHGG